jgi:hypothetical protein
MQLIHNPLAITWWGSMGTRRATHYEVNSRRFPSDLNEQVRPFRLS